MTNPSTSSMTAAPRMIRASGDLRLTQILQHAGGDTDAGRGQHRPEKRVHVHAAVGKEEPADAPTEGKRGDDAQHRDQQRRHTHFQHVAHGRFEADFE